MYVVQQELGEPPNNSDLPDPGLRHVLMSQST